MTLKIEDIVYMPNIAELLSGQQLRDIGKKVLDDVEIDQLSRKEWDMEVEEARELVKMKDEIKSTPWEKAANIKYPLIASAAIQFAARIGPEIVRGTKVAEATVVGKDQDGSKAARAKRVSQHMSYQLIVESDTWEESNDKMLHMVPIDGTVLKKTYFDPQLRQNVSIMIPSDEMAINDNIKSLEEARRISHIMPKHISFVLENIRSGLYLEVDTTKLPEQKENDPEEVSDIHDLIEYHGYLDLDEDGYEEPYIVTVHKDSAKVLRIVARFDEENIERNIDGEVAFIKPNQHFTDFHFLPSFTGGFWSSGYGLLLLHLNKSVNSTINKLMDAGTLANMQGGFISRGLRIKGGMSNLKPGEWKKVDGANQLDIQRNIVPLIYKEPSNVLFSMLGLLIDAGKELSAVTDALTGQEQAQNSPATTILSLIEQGLKVFSSIQKRLYRSYKKEFKKIYDLNRVFLEEADYQRVIDEPNVSAALDYNSEDLDIVPVADPTMSSDAQRLAKLQALMQTIQIPGANVQEILKRYYEGLEVPSPEMLLAPPAQGPSPEQIEAEQKARESEAQLLMKDREMQVKEQEMELKMAKLEAETQLLKAQAIDALARAEAAEAGTQLNAYKAQLDTLKVQLDEVRAQQERQLDESDTGSDTGVGNTSPDSAPL